MLKWLKKLKSRLRKAKYSRSSQYSRQYSRSLELADLFTPDTNWSTEVAFASGVGSLADEPPLTQPVTGVAIEEDFIYDDASAEDDETDGSSSSSQSYLSSVSVESADEVLETSSTQTGRFFAEGSRRSNRPIGPAIDDARGGSTSSRRSFMSNPSVRSTGEALEPFRLHGEGRRRSNRPIGTVSERRDSYSATVQDTPSVIPFPMGLTRSRQDFPSIREQEVASEMQAWSTEDIESDRINFKYVRLQVDEDERPILLGSGSYGNVYLGKLYREECAIKVVNKGKREQQARFLREIKILSSLRSKHITAFMGYSCTPDGLLLFMEYLPGGTLYDSLQEGDLHRWYSRGKEVMMALATALCVLEAKNLIHGDIKSPNCLCDDNGEIKLADFGLSKLLWKAKQRQVLTTPGSIAWAAPECFHHKPLIYLKSDIYSAGVVLWEVCTGLTPTMRPPNRGIRVPEEGPQEVFELIAMCRQENPLDRPDAGQFLELLSACPS